MPVIIRKKDLGIDNVYEAPLEIEFGISDKTVENPKMVMGHTIIPPGTRSRRHYHVNCNVGMYRIKGRSRSVYGPDYDLKEYEIEPGDFTFVPAGEIHGGTNLSNTEPIEMVFCYIGVNSIKEAKTIFVEPPLK